MDATCTIQDSIHVFSLVHKYVSRILGTYQVLTLFLGLVYNSFAFIRENTSETDRRRQIWQQR